MPESVGTVMRMVTLRRDIGVSLVQQIVCQLRQLVDDRILRAGTRLSSIRDFARLHDVSVYTVAEAYDRLAAEHYLQARPRSGYFVCPVRGGGGEGVVGVSGTQAAIELISGREAGPDRWPPRWGDPEPMRQALRALALAPADVCPTQGHIALRRFVCAQFAACGIDAIPAATALAHDVWHAIDLLLRGLGDPGRCILVDDPASPRLLAVLRAHGGQCIPVPRTEEGPDLVRLEALAIAHRPVLLLTQSVLHDPTGSRIAPAQAHRLLRLAEQHDFHIIDHDGEGMLADPPMPRLATLDQLNRVIQVGAIGGPWLAADMGGVQVAYVAAARPHVARFLALLEATGGGSRLEQHLAYLVLTDGDWRRSMRRLRERVARAARSLHRALAAAGYEIAHGSENAVFLWARGATLEHADDLRRRAHARGIPIVPGASCRVDGGNVAWFRLNVAQASEAGLVALLQA